MYLCISLTGPHVSSLCTEEKIAILTHEVLRHALRFACDSEKIFHQGRKYFSRRSPPYSIQLAGKTLYVLTEPEDFVEIYRNGPIFSFDFLVD